MWKKAEKRLSSLRTMILFHRRCVGNCSTLCNPTRTHSTVRDHPLLDPAPTSSPARQRNGRCLRVRAKIISFTEERSKILFNRCPSEPKLLKHLKLKDHRHPPSPVAMLSPTHPPPPPYGYLWDYFFTPKFNKYILPSLQREMYR